MSGFDTTEVRAQINGTIQLQRIEDGLRQMDHKQIAATVGRLLEAGENTELRVVYFKWITLQGRAHRV